ncbi:Thioredoxin family protein [Trichomonas vaginalis G3]|uniref:Thioredoxin family protein n=1 Tax=Trichomonas vaginalis (strain ATCC PRA-98 / G3) TaxID=412133 RepID=A2EBQ5_TRIV3|nr:cell redox homeostasis [Trichomonas vaginalis G3]EAY09867.1 Thioredoxin family protein [Trichomonas vaginalis G3]KAI5514670.1 cell redox homeostasis [Trichomonas vaginalis G3]|eukprot:XP_001322090.1 Thioredoxin family protein [Trichomonas vaginalis G3]
MTEESHPDNILVFNGTLDELMLVVNSKETLVVLDIFWVWCGPCRKLSENLPQIAKENPDVFFIKIDSDKNPQIVEKYEVQMFPTLIFMKKSNLLEIHIGSNIRDIKEKIQLHKGNNLT